MDQLFKMGKGIIKNQLNNKGGNHNNYHGDPYSNQPYSNSQYGYNQPQFPNHPGGPPYAPPPAPYNQPNNGPYPYSNMPPYPQPEGAPLGFGSPWNDQPNQSWNSPNHPSNYPPHPESMNYVHNNMSHNNQVSKKDLGPMSVLKVFDKDGDGQITENDFVLAAKQMGLGFIGEPAARRAFKQLDKNRNGKLEFSEAIGAIGLLKSFSGKGHGGHY